MYVRAVAYPSYVGNRMNSAILAQYPLFWPLCSLFVFLCYKNGPFVSAGLVTASRKPGVFRPRRITESAERGDRSVGARIHPPGIVGAHRQAGRRAFPGCAMVDGDRNRSDADRMRPVDPAGATQVWAAARNADFIAISDLLL
jgi:hypothetical protein